MQKIIIPTGLVSIASMSRIPVGVLLAAAAAVAITEITELQVAQIMRAKTPYETLGLPVRLAQQADVRRAFRTVSRMVHPDKMCPWDPPIDCNNMANEVMHKLSSARDVLNDFHQQMALLDSLDYKVPGELQTGAYIYFIFIFMAAVAALLVVVLAAMRKRRAVAGSPRRRRREANLGHRWWRMSDGTIKYVAAHLRSAGELPFSPASISTHM